MRVIGTALRPRRYKLPNVINLLIQSGRTLDAVRLDGWRIDIKRGRTALESIFRLSQMHSLF